MTVIEKIIEINDILKDIFTFTQSNQEIKADFDEYLATIGSKNISLNQMEKIFLPYIFERKLNGKSIIEMYSDENKKYETVTEGLKKAISSIFEIKKVLRNGFELYNLINEKTYTVLSLTKMSHFKGIYASQYIVARTFDCGEESYLVEISSILSPSQKEEAYRYAVMKLVQSPNLLYHDNPEKESEIKSLVSEMHKKSLKTFDTDIILTTSKHADEIIGAFNEDEEIDLSDKGSNIDKYRFFHVKELDNNYANFLENSMGGFSSHGEVYDVALIFDEKKGLYAIPFYETFCKIFEDKEAVENAKQCVEYFLINESIPDTILARVSSKYPNFMEVINGILNENFTYEEMIKKYKPEYIENTIYSSATVLYCSKAFSEIFDYISLPKPEKPEITQKVGRNELCPCGSGKKYKHCCGKV